MAESTELSYRIDTSSFTEEDRARWGQLKEEIALAVRDLGDMLLEVKQKEYYLLDGYRTWENWCAQMNYTVRRADQIIDAAVVTHRLLEAAPRHGADPNKVPLPNERQARELKAAFGDDPDRIWEAWDSIHKEAEKEGYVVTARSVRAYVSPAGIKVEEPPVPVETEGLIDGLGRRIEDPELTNVFMRAFEFRILEKSLRSCHSLYKKLMNNPAGEYLIQEGLLQLADVARRVKFAQPWVPAPQKLRENNAVIGRLGWLNREQWEALPDEQRE